MRVCAQLRADGCDLPVLMLTARDGAAEHVAGLDAGADDYLAKPFSYAVLLARLRALLRRGPARLPPVLRHGPLTLDPARHRCTRDGAALDLTPREFAVLRYLLAHREMTVTKQDLLDHGGARTTQPTTTWSRSMSAHCGARSTPRGALADRHRPGRWLPDAGRRVRAGPARLLAVQLRLRLTVTGTC